MTASELELDPVHGLQADEPDSWTPTVSKEVGIVPTFVQHQSLLIR